jgi:hypothetical protein
MAKTHDAISIVDSLPKPIVRKLHDLEMEVRQKDAAVEAIKKDLKDAKEEADGAHAALTDYVRALSDPEYFPLFKATVDPDTGEIGPVNNSATE